MLIRYNKFDERTRDRIRLLESKGHIGYIRYLLMRRMLLSEIIKELMRMGLSWAEEDDLLVYFRNALMPLIREFQLEGYYKKYKEGKSDDRLSFQKTFKRSEIDRKRFCECIREMEIDHFFAQEITDYYGSRENIPLSDRDGKPVITTEKVPNFTDILNHPKRPLIESMMVDGKTPRMIEDYLDRHYDIQLPAKDITFYAKSFFKTQRRDLERTIDDLNTEKEKLEESIRLIRDMDDSTMSLGQKSAAIANAKGKVQQLEAQIKRLMGHHSHAAYHEGILEFAQMREMFADVMIRTHRRFQDLDQRSEDEVVGLLSTVASTMARATDKILSLDDRLSASSKKTVVEEMLEVVMPTLDRVMEEEKEAFRKYNDQFGSGSNPEIPEDADILGIDD